MDTARRCGPRTSHLSGDGIRPGACAYPPRWRLEWRSVGHMGMEWLGLDASPGSRRADLRATTCFDFPCLAKLAAGRLWVWRVGMGWRWLGAAFDRRRL